MAAALVTAVPVAASAATSAASEPTPPNLITLLSGYNKFWHSNGSNDLHGSVLAPSTLEYND